jgi:hypothetical protein
MSNSFLNGGHQHRIKEWGVKNFYKRLSSKNPRGSQFMHCGPITMGLPDKLLVSNFRKVGNQNSRNEGSFYRLKKMDDLIGQGIVGIEFKKRLYSVTDMVTEIGATEWFWRSQLWNGNLPYIQVGKKYLIDCRDIEEFIKKNKYQN